MNRNKYLAKNTLIFTLGNMGSKLINFFLVPLYTNILSTSEYGTVDLVSTVCTITVPIITLNICESVMRFALDKDADRKQITRIGTYILCIGFILGLLIVPICSLYRQISDYVFLTYLYVVTMAASQLFLCDLRGKELLLKYSIGNILHTFLIAIFNIVFLVWLRMGVTGYLLAFVLSNLFTAIYAIIVGKAYTSFKYEYFDHTLVKNMIRYSVVLIPNSFMWWIMDSSDRIMVTSFVGIAANGIYAISYKLPTLVTTTTAIFNQAWSYSAIRENGAKDEEEYNNSVFKKIICIVTLIGVGIIAFSKPFLKIYVANDYYLAWKYIPFLTVGCVFLTMATFMGTSYTVHKDSLGYLMSGLLGAILNIVLNFILIPIFNVYGAAFATCFSYISVFVFRLFHTRKYIRYNIKCKEFFTGIMFLLISGFSVYINGILGVIIPLGCFCVICITSSVVWLPIIKKIASKIKKTFTSRMR